MSAAFRAAGFWLETVQGHWISDSDIVLVKSERSDLDGRARYIAHRRDFTRYELKAASYEAAFGSGEVTQ